MHELFFSNILVNTSEMSIPDDVVYSARRLSNYSRNRFKLMPTTSDAVQPGGIVSVTLPEMSTLDLQSVKFHFDVATTVAGADAHRVYGRLPADTASLISRLEVYINGVQVSGSLTDYGTAHRLLKISRTSRDKDGSIDRALSHGTILKSTVNGTEDVSVVLTDFLGFLGESSPRYLNCDMTGQIMIRLTFADASVIGGKVHDVEMTGANYADGTKRTNATNVTYSVSKMFFTVDSVHIADEYTEMLRERLQTEEYIPVLFKEYYSFQNDSITTSNTSVRFGLAATSVDRIYGTFRDANYNTRGVKTHKVEGGLLSDALVNNHYKFICPNNSTDKQGNFVYQYRINSCAYPQYEAGVLDALFECAHTRGKSSMEASGILPTSLEQFQSSLFVAPLTLCHPGSDLKMQSGYNSKGINSQLEFAARGMTLPTEALASSGASGILSCYVLCETTAELRIKLGRDVSVSF